MKEKTKTAGKTATQQITMIIEGNRLSLAEYMYLKDLLSEERERWEEFALDEDSITASEMIKTIDSILEKIERY